MDAEKLRSTYNNYFSGGKNLWTSNDAKKTMKVARQTIGWLKNAGFTKPNGKVLDVGCATGYYSDAFRRLGFEVTGLDYSDVAVQQATVNFPQCRFVQMNGFEPIFHEKFDVIFCRGFSGANTHDVAFVANWVNKYINFLSNDGYFVLGYSSDFSGGEKEGETVNLTRVEIDQLAGKIQAHYSSYNVFYYFGFLSKLKRTFEKNVLGKRVKDYYYLVFRKP
ncbi:MAG: class I SAM-dependent methyltransferase [Cyclobacteriaceae bacterium]